MNTSKSWKVDFHERGNIYPWRRGTDYELGKNIKEIKDNYARFYPNRVIEKIVREY